MDESFELRVKLFASVREALGAGEVAVRLPAGADARDLLAALEARHPALGPLGPSLAVAVNHAVVGRGHPLAAGDEVALLPPVGGG